MEPKQRRQGAEGFLAGDLHLRVDIGNHCRLEKTAAQFMTLSAGNNPGTLVERILNMLLDLLNRRHIDQRSLLRFAFETRADAHLVAGRSELFSKFVIHPILDQKAVCADAGLPCIAVFRGHCSVNRRIHIGIVENDERRVATKLHGNFLYRGSALLDQNLANLGGAGEGELTDDRVGGYFRAHLARRAGEDVEYARRNAGALAQLAERQCRIGCRRGGARNHGTTRRQCRAGLACDHRVGKNPRRDQADNADRFLGHDDTPIICRLRNHIAVSALPFFGEPFDERRAIANFAARFGHWLALLSGHNNC